MRRTAAALGALAAATVLAYLPALDGPFVFDDVVFLREPRIGPGSWWAGTRPLTALTFAASDALGGRTPLPWHLVGLALHLAAAALAFAVARRTLARAGLARPEGAALLAAGIFALHPLQTEAVSYVWQRAEVLAGALSLATLLLLLLRDEARGARRAALLAAAAATHALALAAKPVAAALPVAWLLHAALLPPPGEERVPPLARLRARLLAAAPLLALSVVAALAGAVAASSEAAREAPGPGGPVGYLARQLVAVPTYLLRLAVPAAQCADCAVPGGGWPAVAGAVVIAAVAALAVALALAAPRLEGDSRAAARTAAFGLLFAGVALAPSSSVVPLRDALAEHRAYLAVLGFALAVAAGGTWAARRALPPRARRLAPVAAAALLLALAAATAARNQVWADPIDFWTDAVEKAPGKARPHMNLGAALLEAGDPAAALPELERAWALRRDGSIWRSDVLGARGLVSLLAGARYATGRGAAARALVGEALADAPGAPGVLATAAQLALVEGRLDDAEDALALAAARGPDDADVLALRGEAALARGDAAAAREALARAAERLPDDPHVLELLGAAEARLGHAAAACAALARAAALPGNAAASARAGAATAKLGCGAAGAADQPGTK